MLIGANVSTAGGLANAFIWAREWEAECIQIYTTPSRSWRAIAKSEIEVETFKTARQATHNIPVIAHVPYLVNLASPNQVTRRRSIERLTYELLAAGRLGIDRIVLHPGSTVGDDIHTGLGRTISGINEALRQQPGDEVAVLLETMAGRGSEIGGCFEDLARIMMQVEDNCRLGVCFDTCHIFAAGYDLRGQHGLEKVLTEFDKVVGARHIGAFHLNDSRQPLGSKGDRHSVIGAGLLGLEVFRALVTDSRFVTVPGISESPDKGGGCLHDIQLLKRLRAGGLITEVDWCS